MNHSFRELMNSKKLFFSSIAVSLLMAILALLFFGKTFGYISPGIYHGFWINIFFINYTFMGDGLFAICLAAILVGWFKKKQEGYALLYAFLVAETLVQLFDNLTSYPVVKLFFEEGQYLFSLAHDHGGLISGHTAVAFALATVFMLIKKAKWQIPIMIAAVLVGYSRIYLAQHFLSDVLLGAVTGILSGIAGIYFAYYFKGVKYFFKKFYNVHNNNTDAVKGNIQPV